MQRTATLRALILLICSIVIVAATIPAQLREPEHRAAIQRAPQPRASVTFSPDGRVHPIAHDAAIHLWDAPTDK